MFVWVYRFVKFQSREFNRLLKDGWEVFQLENDNKTVTVRKMVKKEEPVTK